MAPKCGHCGLPAAVLVIPKRLAGAANLRGSRPSPSADWVEKDVCICCDLVDRYTGVCRHQKEKQSRGPKVLSEAVIEFKGDGT